MALLERLYADRAVSLSTAASEVYYQTLQRFHGWIVTGTFTVALKLVPSRWVLAKRGSGWWLACCHFRHLSLCGACLRDGWRDPLRLPPCCREDFFSKVGVAAGDEGAMEAMHAFCTAFSGVLAEIQQFLAENGLDDPAKV